MSFDLSVLLYVLGTSVVTLAGAYLPILFKVRELRSELELEKERWNGEKKFITRVQTDLEKDLQENIDYTRRINSKYNTMKLVLVAKKIMKPDQNG